MTSSPNASVERVTGSSPADRPSTPAVRWPPAAKVVTGPGWMRLSRGMLIQALIEARLLGKRLLTLNAEIIVLPAEGGDRRRPGPSASPNRRRANGTGRGLAAAARSLEAGSDELKSARDALP